MKKVGLAVFSLVVAVGLLVGGASVAKATPTPTPTPVDEVDFTFGVHSGTVSVTPNTNPSTMVQYPYLATITESTGGGWVVQGFDAGSAVTSPLPITGGTISISASDPTDAFFTGNIGATSFTLDLQIVPGTEAYSKSTNSYLGWNSNVPTLGTGLSTLFSPSGPYGDAFAATFSGKGLTITGGGVTLTAAPVPIPPSVLLFAPGLLGLVGIRKGLKG